MFGLPILEVAIGLCFIYLLLALICSTINETIAGITSRRAKLLEQGINSLLGDNPGLKQKLFAHPLIASLASGSSGPSYIPSSKFALALMDVVTGPEKAPNDGAALRAASGVTTPGKHNFQQTLCAVLVDERTHLHSDQAKIEDWYNDAMARVSGWYKRNTLVWIWALAAVVTLALNADTFTIFRVLWTNQGVRSAVVESAKARAQAPRPEELVPLVEYSEQDKPKEAASVNPQSHAVLTDSERAELNQLTSWKTDIGKWQKMDTGPLVGDILLHLLGWLFTIAAVSLGAPFWFDMLNKFMNVRNSGPPTGQASNSTPPSGPSSNTAAPAATPTNA